MYTSTNMITNPNIAKRRDLFNLGHHAVGGNMTDTKLLLTLHLRYIETGSRRSAWWTSVSQSKSKDRAKEEKKSATEKFT